MYRFRLPIAAFLALGLWCGAAWADTLKFTASLAPEKTGAAKGTATLTVDTGSKKMDWSIEYSGLSAPPAMAAIMSPPKDPKGEPGTLPLTLPAKPTSPVSGSMQVTDDQIAGFKTGQWMVMIGNAKAPEIGGEIKPAP
ncbi:MAG TPA: CHRD domain-containing protein [Stellaceae bacterium]|nr:CHRD domain-containing protein [Stellaceae bacterium]